MGYSIEIDEIKDGALWVRIDVDGVPVWKEPLAAALRRHIEPEFQADEESGDHEKGFRTEAAFRKLAIGKAFEAELNRA